MKDDVFVLRFKKDSSNVCCAPTLIEMVSWNFYSNLVCDILLLCVTCLLINKLLSNCSAKK